MGSIIKDGIQYNETEISTGTQVVKILERIETESPIEGFDIKVEIQDIKKKLDDIIGKLELLKI